MPRWRSWIGVGSAVALAALGCFWGVWGGFEAFHEGAHGDNYLWTTLPYAIPCLVCWVPLLLSAWKPVVGGLSILALAIGLFLFLAEPWEGQIERVVTFGAFLSPMAIAGVAMTFGRWPEPPERWKRFRPYVVLLALPPATLVVAGSIAAAMTFPRFDDGIRGERSIVGLRWSEEQARVSWDEAAQVCADLGDEWRLPTPDELVRAGHRGGRPAGGRLEDGVARYDRRPNKETPLWTPRSTVIYLWSSQQDGERARVLTFEGGLFWKPKQFPSPSMGVRCVTEG